MTGRVAVVVVLLGAVLCGCAGPSRTDEDFRRKAGSTAEAVGSALATARLAVQGAADGQVSGPYASVVVGEAERDASAARGTFEAYQPPSTAADEVRAAVDDLVSEAVDGVSRMHIEVRRGELERAGRRAAQLADVQRRLEQVQERYR